MTQKRRSKALTTRTKTPETSEPKRQEQEKISVEYVRLDELVRWPRNPKEHDGELISGLIQRFGFINPIIRDEASGKMVAGHGRLDSLIEKKARGEEPPHRIGVDEDGMWTVPVLRGVSFDNERDAEAYVVGDNQATIAGGWDEQALLEILHDFSNDGDQELLDLVGYGEEDLRALEQSVGLHISTQQAEDERSNAKGKRPSEKRKIPVDAIFTVKGSGSYCCLATKAGLKYGTQSSTSYICPNIHERGHEVCFIDNEWHDYSHEKHRRFVGRYRAKYATVIDVMTEEQCRQSGVKFYPFDQIMRWAEDLQDFCENVIVIPKYDCIKDIPDKYVLGYSVPSSYGATPLPLEVFRGRRVHLLGGSWERQLESLATIGDSIVSLDFNWVHKVAMHGQFVMPSGEAVNLSKLLPFMVTNPGYVCCALSFGAIASALKELCGLSPEVLEVLKDQDVTKYLEERLVDPASLLYTDR